MTALVRARPPFPAVLGAAVLSLALAANLAASLGADLPAGPGVVGLTVFFRVAAHVQTRTYVVIGCVYPALFAGLILLWSRLGAEARRAVEPAYASGVTLLFALPPLSDGQRLAGAVPREIAAAALIAALGLVFRRPRALPAALLAVPGAAAGLFLAALAGMEAPAPALAGAAIAVSGGILLARWISPGAMLAAAVPLCLLPWESAMRARLIDERGVAGGYDLPHHVALLLGAVAAGSALILLAGRRWPRLLGARGARRLLLVVGLPLLGAGMVFRYNVQSLDIDGLHEGEPLASAKAIQDGQLPYRGVVFFHGLGEDPGRALIAFRLFGRSVRGLRVLRDLLNPAASAIFLALVAVVLPARWTLLMSAAVLSWWWLAPPAGRSLLSDGALLVLAMILVRPHPRFWPSVCGGALAAAAALWGLDTGLAVLAATLGAVAVRALLDSRARRAALGWAVGAVVVLAGFASWLVTHGLAGSFLATAADVASGFAIAYARPFRFTGDSPMTFFARCMAPAALAAGAAVLVLRLLRGELVRRTWLLLLLWFAAFASYQRATDRFDIEHAVSAAHLVWPMLVLLVSLARRWEAHAAAVVTALLLFDVPGQNGILPALRAWGGRSNVSIAGRVRIDSPRAGVLVSAAQGRELAPLLAFLDRLPPGATFYDFTNNGALYFLADRRLPTRYTQVWLAETIRAQRDVVGSLERDPPAVVLFRSSTSHDAFDSVDNRLRHWIIAEHLVARFRPRWQVGGFQILSAGDAPVPGEQMKRYADELAMGSIPYAWGRGGLPAGAGAAEIQGERTAGGSVRFVLAPPGRARPAAVLLRFSATREGKATLRWDVGGGATGGVRFDVIPGEGVTYLVPLSTLPAWVWPEALGPVDLEIADEAPEAVAAFAVSGTLDGLVPR